MGTKLKVLIENTAFQTDVRAEHGFSLFIENEGKKIVFDLGQTDALFYNANIFNIDMSDIDSVVLSHGHYDHTGGLAKFLSINKKAKVFAKRDFDGRKFSLPDRYVGVPCDSFVDGERLVYVDSPTALSADVFVMPDIEIFHVADTHFNRFRIENERGLCEDFFEDELYLAIKSDKGLCVVTGCAHRGICNIIESAEKACGEKVRILIGGFHIKNDSDETVINLAEKLNGYGVEAVYTCHCTGIEKYALLKCHCPKINVEYCSTGKSIYL